MNLSSVKDCDLIAEMKRRKFISGRMVTSIINRAYGLDTCTTRAKGWAETHPKELARMEEIALSLLKEGKKSVRLPIEILRMEGIKIPNEYAKVLNSILVKRRPELQSLFIH